MQLIGFCIRLNDTNFKVVGRTTAAVEVTILCANSPSHCLFIWAASRCYDSERKEKVCPSQRELNRMISSCIFFISLINLIRIERMLNKAWHVRAPLELLYMSNWALCYVFLQGLGLGLLFTVEFALGQSNQVWIPACRSISKARQYCRRKAYKETKTSLWLDTLCTGQR